MKKIILTLCAVLALGGVNAMEKVEQTYFPASEEEVRKSMQSQEALDQFVAERAVYYYAGLNSRFRYPKHDEPLDTPSKFWQNSKEIISDDSNSNLKGFSHKLSTISGTISSEALIDLFNQGGVIECRIAVQLVKNLILLDILGAENFNILRDELSLPSNCDFTIGEARACHN